MPGRRVSWLSTVPWVGGGEEAARGFWRGAFQVVPLCRLAMFLNQVRKIDAWKAVKAADFFIQGVFMLVRAKPRYTGHINFWSMYNMQRFHLFPILFQTRPKSLLSIWLFHTIWNVYFRQCLDNKSLKGSRRLIRRPEIWQTRDYSIT